MKKIGQFTGKRTKSGFHTGSAIYQDSKGSYWLSIESGLRRLTKKEINILKITQEGLR